MTKTEERKLKTALRRLEKCGGDCHHCEKCRVYTRSTERALYMAVGCDLLPVEMFSYIADTPEGPEEVNGYSCYIVADTEEGIKKELAAVAGCAPSDIVMRAFDEFIRVPQYKAV